MTVMALHLHIVADALLVIFICHFSSSIFSRHCARQHCKRKRVSAIVCCCVSNMPLIVVHRFGSVGKTFSKLCRVLLKLESGSSSIDCGACKTHHGLAHHKEVFEHTGSLASDAKTCVLQNIIQLLRNLNESIHNKTPDYDFVSRSLCNIHHSLFYNGKAPDV